MSLLHDGHLIDWGELDGSGLWSRGPFTQRGMEPLGAVVYSPLIDDARLIVAVRNLVAFS